MRRSFCATVTVGLFAAGLGIAVAPTARAFDFAKGDIVAPQSDNNGTILVVHPATGDREVLSLYPGIGQGPRQRRPSSIALAPDGSFLVAESFTALGIFRIDGQTGNRTFLSGDGSGFSGDPAARGTGPIDEVVTVLQSGFQTFLINQGGRNSSTGFITSVDLITGNRTVISGHGVGAGPTFSTLEGGVIDTTTGHLIVADYGLEAVFDVDLQTGARTIISGPTRGTGQPLASVRDLVILPDGDIVTTDINFDNPQNGIYSSLLRINRSTGNRTVIQSHSPDYQRIALAPNGHILASPLYAILDIDPLTGDSTVVSANGLVGGGPNLFWGDMLVMTTPEPATGLFLVPLAGALLNRPRRTDD